jgi:signal transduction histidine kinase
MPRRAFPDTTAHYGVDELIGIDTTAQGSRSTLKSRFARPWMGWRLRLLVGAALMGCLCIYGLVHHLAQGLSIDAIWTANSRGQVVLGATTDPALRPHLGQALISVEGADGISTAIDESILNRTPRWTVDSTVREHVVGMHRALGQALATGQVNFIFDDGSRALLFAQPRGIAGVGLLFWPLAVLALLLYTASVVVLLVKPQWRNVLYFMLASFQATNLLFIAIETAHGIPLPDLVVAQDLRLRVALDIVSAAAIIHAFTLHPVPLRHGAWAAAAAWGAAIGSLAGLHLYNGTGLWWWSQGAVLALGTSSLLVLTWSYRVQPNPLTLILRRFGYVTMGSMALLTLALAAASGVPGIQHRVAEVGPAVWYIFLAAMLLLAPFLTRSSQLQREFALLAGISTVATSLDLLFVAIFSFGQFASVTLSVFLALGVYAGARQWILNQLVGSNVLTLERSFERLYRVAREVEAHPERHEQMLLGLLRDIFDPLDVQRIARQIDTARAVGDGSAMLVPVPPDGVDGKRSGGDARAWLLRYARRGKRLFTAEDARLADRICEQLRRAVVFDRAVEQGRSEERLRIAQDLHDDIGARLLTLIYKAQTPEMEDYLRHTLQDLKTLTRGLVASNHRLSHALAEWKSDISQRLEAARISLSWSFEYDEDVALNVVQWSALTRMLRELVTNSIYHARATQIEIDAVLERGRLQLRVADDGEGRDPQAWPHGLGLGGVRKRVKMLGGQVQWRENGARGIVCQVEVPDFVSRGTPASAPP